MDVALPGFWRAKGRHRRWAAGSLEAQMATNLPCVGKLSPLQSIPRGRGLHLYLCRRGGGQSDFAEVCATIVIQEGHPTARKTQPASQGPDRKRGVKKVRDEATGLVIAGGGKEKITEK